MVGRHRVAALIFLAAGVAGLLLLVAGLSGMEMTTEWRFYDFGGEEAIRPFSGDWDSDAINRFLSIPRSVLQALLLSLMILVPLSLILALFSEEMRRTILTELKRAIVIVLIIAAVIIVLRRLNLNGREGAPMPGLESAPDMPHWIAHPSALAAFIIAVLLLSLLLIIGWRAWLRRRPQPLQRIAAEAQATMKELRAGRDFRNAITECYFRMCRVLQEERRIKRAEGMTPREFARYLEEVGLASGQAMRLTRLFEAVRYGARTPGAREEKEAMECLSIFEDPSIPQDVGER